MMGNLERRLMQLETRMTSDADHVPWADVYAATRRQQARALLALAKRLGMDADDLRLREAMSWLQGDDPLRVRQDAEMVARWHRQQGITVDTAGARQRITARLALMARRMRDDEARPSE
jgi:hypothetical protein